MTCPRWRVRGPRYVRTARGRTHHESADEQIDVEGCRKSALCFAAIGFCYVGENGG